MTSSLILEYISLKNMVNSAYYQDKINKMNYYKNCPSSGEDNSMYLKLKEELDNDPILKNFEIISHEVEDYLKEIKDQLIIGK